MGNIKSFSSLRPGAIFFKYRSDFTGTMISFGQLLREYAEDRRKNVLKQQIDDSPLDITHVLLYIGNGRVIEAIASGVQASPLTDGHNLHQHFQVFNPVNDELAANAVKLAKSAAYGKGGYSHGGLVNAGVASMLSLFASLSPAVRLVSDITGKNAGDIFKPTQNAYKESLVNFVRKIEHHEPVDFFCSELAAFCYDAAALKMGLPMIATEFSHHSTPKDFLTDVGASSHFTYVGDIKPDEINPAEITHSNTLYEGEALGQGEYLLSSNGKYKFIYQEDGNLVLYTMDGNKHVAPKWASNTQFKECLATLMQYDGNLVVWDNVPVMNTPKLSWNPLEIIASAKGKSDAVWQANVTSDAPNKRCVLTDDGDICLVHSGDTIYHHVYKMS